MRCHAKKGYGQQHQAVERAIVCQPFDQDAMAMHNLFILYVLYSFAFWL
jgi:hypothetical protein